MLSLKIMDRIRLEEVMTRVRIEEMQRIIVLKGLRKNTRIPVGKPVPNTTGY
jgi:hypothetical protein